MFDIIGHIFLAFMSIGMAAIIDSSETNTVIVCVQWAVVAVMAIVASGVLTP